VRAGITACDPSGPDRARRELRIEAINRYERDRYAVGAETGLEFHGASDDEVAHSAERRDRRRVRGERFRLGDPTSGPPRLWRATASSLQARRALRPGSGGSPPTSACTSSRLASASAAAQADIAENCRIAAIGRSRRGGTVPHHRAGLRRTG